MRKEDVFVGMRVIYDHIYDDDSDRDYAERHGLHPGMHGEVTIISGINKDYVGIKMDEALIKTDCNVVEFQNSIFARIEELIPEDSIPNLSETDLADILSI